MAHMRRNHNHIFIRLFAGVLGLSIAASCTWCRSDAKNHSNVDTTLLRDSISKIVSTYPGEIGVAVIVDNTDTVTVNDRNIYPMMSVFKLHQSLAVCHDFDRRGTGLDSLISIDRSDLDQHTWSPMLKEHPEEEITLSVAELMRYALIQSDNNASNLMFKRLVNVAQTDSFIATVVPRRDFRIVYTEEEMSADHSRAYANSTSPLGAAILINRIFTDSIVSQDKQSFIAGALSECRTGTDRIVAPLLGRPGITAAHKTGSGYRNERGILAAHNDVAYISLPDGISYSLAVFVKDFNGDEAQAAAAIARVSDAVYYILSLTDKQ